MSQLIPIKWNLYINFKAVYEIAYLRWEKMVSKGYTISVKLIKHGYKKVEDVKATVHAFGWDFMVPCDWGTPKKPFY